MPHLICFGDSITRGENDPVYGGWVDRLKVAAIKTFLSVKSDELCVFNLGIGGETSGGLVKRFDAELAPRMASDGINVAIIGYGANDLATVNGRQVTPIETYIDNIRQCIKSAKQKNVIPVVINILPISSKLEGQTNDLGKCRNNSDIELYNERLLALTREMSTQLIDLNQVFENKEDLLTFDGIHPNARGHEVLYQFIKGQIKLLGLNI